MAKLLTREMARLDFEVLDVGRFVRTLAGDPLAALGRYERGLLSTARARQNALADRESDSLNFALNTLLSVRMRGLSRHLMTLAVDRDALEGFLAHSLELATDAIGNAEDAEDLADALAAALDEVHSYVVAHGLVASGYLEGEREFTRRLLEGALQPSSDDPDESNGDRAAAKTVAALALAA